jgi:hypothetical protein
MVKNQTKSPTVAAVNEEHVDLLVPRALTRVAIDAPGINIDMQGTAQGNAVPSNTLGSAPSLATSVRL